MRIVWFSWKDINHPEAGGAELVSDHIRKNLSANGHSVILITARYRNSKKYEAVDGIEVLRYGGKYSVYAKARKQYRGVLEDGPVDLVVDEMNTLPFFAGFYSGDVPRILLTYQLARKVWFYQMVFPLSLVGYILEPLYLKLISGRYNLILTESESTKCDLQKYGFNQDAIRVFKVGMELEPLRALGLKKVSGNILFLGALRPMKRPLEAVRAFEHARERMPRLRLKIAGDTSGKHGKKVLDYINKSKHKSAISVLGRVSGDDRINLLKNSDIILVTSVKEGWGLIVTEANSQGTPAVAYNTDGLRDSIIDNETGLLVDDGDNKKMGNTICELLLDASKYKYLRTNAYSHSKQFTFSNSYNDFINAVKKVVDEKKAN